MHRQSPIQYVFGGISRHCNRYEVKDIGKACTERLYQLEVDPHFGYRELLHIASNRRKGVIDITLVVGLPREQAIGLEPIEMIGEAVPGFRHRTLTLSTLGNAGVEQKAYYINAFVQLRIKEMDSAVDEARRLVDAAFTAYGVPRKERDGVALTGKGELKPAW